MRTKNQIIQDYEMGLLTPGELVFQLRPYYNKLNPFEIFKIVKTELSSNK